MSDKDIDVYHEYYKKQRQKLGFEKYDVERSFIGSALARRPELYPEVDGSYLVGLMPVKASIKDDILDVLEERCVTLMKTRAAQGKSSCKFPIPEIIPGIPRIIPKRAIGPLASRISKRENIIVVPKESEEAYFLEIYWK